MTLSNRLAFPDAVWVAVWNTHEMYPHQPPIPLDPLASL